MACFRCCAAGVPCWSRRLVLIRTGFLFYVQRKSATCRVLTKRHLSVVVSRLWSGVSHSSDVSSIFMNALKIKRPSSKYPTPQCLPIVLRKGRVTLADAVLALVFNDLGPQVLKRKNSYRAQESAEEFHDKLHQSHIGAPNA